MPPHWNLTVSERGWSGWPEERRRRRIPAAELGWPRGETEMAASIHRLPSRFLGRRRSGGRGGGDGGRRSAPCALKRRRRAWTWRGDGKLVERKEGGARGGCASGQVFPVTLCFSSRGPAGSGAPGRGARRPRWSWCGRTRLQEGRRTCPSYKKPPAKMFSLTDRSLSSFPFKTF